MKKIIYLAVLIFVVIGSGCEVKDEAAITIDHINITAEEFERAFKASPFVFKEAEGRKEFLDNYISLKLILKEAETMNLNTDPQFLSEIQSFWERALLKLVLEKRTRELTSDIGISDKEIRQYYQRYKTDHFAGKGLAEVYDQIQWLLLQEKRSQAISAWADSLKTKAKIKINYSRLGLEK